MEKVITIIFDLDIDEFIDKYNLDYCATDAMIYEALEDHLAWQTDEVYYNFETEEVYDYYIESIKDALNKRRK